MLYLTCTIITSVDLAHYGVSRAKDWVSVDCGTILYIFFILYFFIFNFLLLFLLFIIYIYRQEFVTR